MYQSFQTERVITRQKIQCLKKKSPFVCDLLDVATVSLPERHFYVGRYKHVVNAGVKIGTSFYSSTQMHWYTESLNTSVRQTTGRSK